MWGGLFLHWLISYLRFLLLAEIMTWLFNEITIDKLWVPSFFLSLAFSPVIHSRKPWIKVEVFPPKFSKNRSDNQFRQVCRLWTIKLGAEKDVFCVRNKCNISRTVDQRKLQESLHFRANDTFLLSWIICLFFHSSPFSGNLWYVLQPCGCLRYVSEPQDMEK